MNLLISYMKGIQRQWLELRQGPCLDRKVTSGHCKGRLKQTYNSTLTMNASSYDNLRGN